MLSHASQAVRALDTSLLTLWSTLRSAMHEDKVRTYLLRSGDAGLHIFLVEPEDSREIAEEEHARWWAFLATVIPYSARSRWVDLQFESFDTLWGTNTDDEFYARLTRELARVDVSHLENLYLLFPGRKAEEWTIRQENADKPSQIYSTWLMYSLASLSTAEFVSPSLLPGTLVTLRIDLMQIAFKMPYNISDILTILASTSMQSELAISTVDMIPPAVTPPVEVGLQKLYSLNVAFADYSLTTQVIANLLGSLRMPQLKKYN